MCPLTAMFALETVAKHLLLQQVDGAPEEGLQAAGGHTVGCSLASCSLAGCSCSLASCNSADCTCGSSTKKLTHWEVVLKSIQKFSSCSSLGGRSCRTAELRVRRCGTGTVEQARWNRRGGTGGLSHLGGA